MFCFRLHKSQEVIHRQSQLHQELDTNPRSHRTKIRKLQHKLDKYKVLDRVQVSTKHVGGVFSFSVNVLLIN